MPIWGWILLAIVLLLVGLFLFYELYWLGQSQVFLVYQPTLSMPKADEKLLQDVLKATGAQLATQKDVEAEHLNGLNFCTAGVMYKGDGSDKTAYVVGWPTWVDKNFNGSSCGKEVCPANCNKTSGCICGCDCNKMVNYGEYFNGTTGVNVRGFWLKGSKPKSVKGWTVAPFSKKRAGLGKDIGNKFEILGLPKLF